MEQSRPYNYEQSKGFEDWRQEQAEPADAAGGCLRVCIIFNKVMKILINIVVIFLYRIGDKEGRFLGATYNKNKDAEALTAGVFVGYLIYNLVSVMADIITPRISQTQDYRKVVSRPPLTTPFMNFIGTILWMTVGGVCIQFWSRFQKENHFTETNPIAVGIAMGCLAVLAALFYLVDTIISCITYFFQE